MMVPQTIYHTTTSIENSVKSMRATDTHGDSWKPPKSNVRTYVSRQKNLVTLALKAETSSIPSYENPMRYVLLRKPQSLTSRDIRRYNKAVHIVSDVGAK